MSSFRLPTLLATLVLAGAAAAPADAATRLVVRGQGFGHGVGMSQWGAMGFAQQGRDYREILGHYYTGTQIGRLDANPTVRVLLQAGRSTVRFTGARQAADRRLNPRSTYRATPFAGRVMLRSSTGRKLRTVAAPLRIVGAGGVVRLVGGANAGAYRGALEVRPGTLGGLDVVNAVGLEDYVRGVVARESPSSWPAEALKAQAVAARTYAITTNKPGAHFDHYPDTRSQVYGGVAAETASTDAAIAATRGEVVIYDGKPVTTYFFSTSGGRTENVENSLGGEPKPWLKSVEDPYDKVSPRHRWGPYRYTLSRARKKLGRLVKGSLKRIDVTKRGESPRIVEAVVVGTGGTTRVSGATLRRAFGLYDTWAYFNVVGTKVEPDEDAASAAVRANASATHRRAVVRGSITGLERGTEVLVQRRTRAGTWITEARTRIGRRGRYRADVGRAGVYRVKAGAIVGPSVRLR